MNTRLNRSARRERHRKLFNTEKLKVDFDPDQGSSIIRQSVRSVVRTSKSLFKFAHAKNQVSALLALVMIASSTVLPSFAALNTGVSAYSSYDISMGEERFIPYEDQEVMELLGQESLLITESEGVIANPTVTDRSGKVFEAKSVETYIAVEGDTLASIAEKHNISVDTLKFNNGVESDTVRVGQKFNIMPLDGILVTMTKDAPIEEVAKEYAVDLSVLAEENDVTARAQFKAGEKVLIPGQDQIAKAKERLEKQRQEEAKLLAQQQAEQKKAQQISATRTSTSTPSVVANTKASQYVATTQGRKFVWPSKNPVVTQEYRYGHPGIDICYTQGDHTTAIVSVLPGKVIAAAGGWNGGYGNMVLVDHGGGMVTRYAHLREIYVKVGQQVGQGQSIGWMGNTGNVRGRTGLHLHFEVIVNGVKVNPRAYL